MIAASRWTGLAGIAVGNVLPLYLVWTGQLEIPDLVLVYLLELVIAYGLLVVSVPHRRLPRTGTTDTLKLYASLVLGGLLFGTVMASYTLPHVTWDATTLWTVVVTLASSLVGLAGSIWRRGAQWREGLGGAFFWRFALMTIALMAASAGRSYERLIAAGWAPYHFGEGWALPAGELLTTVALAVDLSPVVVAAGILCTYRLVSEVLYEVFDIFRDEAALEVGE